MLMFCNICTCISISMKKMCFCRELMHVNVRVEAKCPFNKNKRVSQASHLAGALCACQRIISVRLQTKGPAPRPPPFSKGYYDHSNRSSVRAGNASTRVFNEEWRGFLMHKS